MTRGFSTAGGVLALALALAGQAGAQPSRAELAARDQQARVLDSVGGAYHGPIVDYVGQVGERVAAAAGKPYQCTFTVVDSDVVNAFTTPPGCYVYVTRGLLALMNSEAELAAVLGHEVGHVTADHARRQKNQAAVSGIAAVLVGAATGSDLAGHIAGKAAQLSTLSYSRNQEYEADGLALRTLPLAGYDQNGLTEVLDDLQRGDEFEARTRGPSTTPAWARTHPLTSDRIRRVAQLTTEAPLTAAEGTRNAAVYLAALDGLIYGDDDSDQGFVRGRSFVHPGLRIAFEAPAGIVLENGPEAVGISGPDGLRGQFASGSIPAGGLGEYARGVLRNAAGRAPFEVAPLQTTTINGFDAVILPARAQVTRGEVEVVVVAYAAGRDSAYHFVVVAPPGRAHDFDPLFGSFHRLADKEAVGPRRIAVITPRAGDTAESLSARMAFDTDRLDRFLMLNGLQRGQPLPPGRPVKLVLYGSR